MDAVEKWEFPPAGKAIDPLLRIPINNRKY
jgi:hypothetical protein